MNRSRLLMIGCLALAVGLLASFTVYNRLRNFGGSINNERAVPVVVATDDIQVGVKVESHDVRVVTLPESAVPPRAFPAAEQLAGRGARSPISKRELLQPSQQAA